MTTTATGAAQPTTLPVSLQANPRLADWIELGDDGTVTVTVGKVELGQGIVTALAQIAADELDVRLADVRMHPASTLAGPDEGVTAGSMSIAVSGSALRLVCAHVRALVIDAAGSAGLDPASTVVRDGRLRDGAGTETTYADLARLVELDVTVDPGVAPKASDQLTVVGTSAPRRDLPDKVAGRPRFIHDLVLPGQLYGRVVRPPSPAARLADVAPGPAEVTDGVVAVVHDGSFLGVVAVDEAAAERGAAALRDGARWLEQASLPDPQDVSGYLRAGPHDTVTVVADPDGAEPDERWLSATYDKPFLAHASMAPSCGVARWNPAGDSVEVWSHSQGIRGLRTASARILGLPESAVAVRHVEGAGCYGHNGADDAAFDAVLLARAVPGRPVHLRWSRADELTWSPLSSAMSIDLAAALDTDGRVVAWWHDVYSQGHTSRPGYAGAPGLLAGAHLATPHDLPPPADPPAAAGAGSARNAVPIYRFPARAIRAHRLTTTALRTSAMRSLGAYANVFAIESFMDELAAAAGSDPLAFRLAHLDDPRAWAVLEAVVDRSGYAGRPRDAETGMGLALARYKDRGAWCAAVAEVAAVSSVDVRRLWLAVDVGRVVNPDGVRNQIEGGAVQSTSWTVREQVRFDSTRITSDTWETYPILRFGETPDVDVHLIDRPDEPSLGAGEAAQGPTAAAIANAVADAIGVRVRRLPLTADAVVAALDA